MSGALLELRGLRVRAPNRVLVDGVDVTVRGGRITALCGPSGAGKSLTARVCLGVVDVLPGVETGSLRYPEVEERDWLAGHHGGGASAWRRLHRSTRHLRGSYLSYAPQAASSALNPGRTVGRQLELALDRRRHPLAGAERTKRMIALLDEVGLGPQVLGSLPGELSGGMCQRAALAVAMACDPRVLVADEPETGLDPLLRRQVVELLVAVGRAHGCGVLLISHHEDTVERLADDVVRLLPPAGASGGAT